MNPASIIANCVWFFNLSREQESSKYNIVIELGLEQQSCPVYRLIILQVNQIYLLWKQWLVSNFITKA